MPQQQPFNLSFGIGTDPAEVQFRFTPAGNEGNVFTYYDKDFSATTFINLEPSFTLSTIRPSKRSHLHQVRMKLTVPTEAVDPNNGMAPTGAALFVDTADITFKFNERTTAERREILLKAIIAALDEHEAGGQGIRDAIINAEVIY